MDALKRRVDPNGLRNLVWRPEGGTRLEIQMPLPPPWRRRPRRIKEDFDKAQQAARGHQRPRRPRSLNASRPKNSHGRRSAISAWPSLASDIKPAGRSVQADGGQNYDQTRRSTPTRSICR